MDQIWVYNKGWVKYCYKGSSAANAQLKRYNADGATADKKYLDLDVTTDVVSNGWSFLYYNKSNKAQTITLSGEVREFVAKPSYTIAKSGGQFIGYPWPVDFPISSITKYCTPTYHNSNFAYMDQAWVYDAGWKKYCYKGSSKTNAQWKRYNADGATAAEKYLDVDDSIDFVPAGQGFLYYNKNNKDMTITFTFGD